MKCSGIIPISTIWPYHDTTVGQIIRPGFIQKCLSSSGDHREKFNSSVNNACTDPVFVHKQINSVLSAKCIGSSGIQYPYQSNVTYCIVLVAFPKYPTMYRISGYRHHHSLYLNRDVSKALKG